MRHPKTYVPEAERYLMAERATLLDCMEGSRRLMREAACRICDIDGELDRLALLARPQAEVRGRAA